MTSLPITIDVGAIDIGDLAVLLGAHPAIATFNWTPGSNTIKVNLTETGNADDLHNDLWKLQCVRQIGQLQES